MELGNILLPSAVKVLTGVTSKKRLFQYLGEMAADCFGVDSHIACSALQQREDLGPTGVGRGVALPHARLQNISGVHGCFLRLDTPMDFGAVDRQPVDLVFTLFAPEDSGISHLKALALVSRTMRDSGICGKLRANMNPDTLHALLTDSLATKAA